MDKLLYVVSATHLVLCPFTKVEESFNMQAMHDILYLKSNLSQYDHLEFPGVVPRTFLGPLFISILSFPFASVFKYLQFNKMFSQLLVRAILGIVVVTSIKYFNKSISKVFGNGVGNWFIILTASQYHLMFYSSRPLPNIMAFPLVMVALSSWIRGKHILLIWSSAIAVLIFRSELVIYLGIIILMELLYKRLKLFRGLKLGFLAAITVLTTSIVIDSIFWGRLVWPEGEVLWFNTVLNKSSEWGTKPFLWYFYSAIPRGVALSLLFIPFGALYDIRVMRLLIPTLMFVLIYSILPHKELRFIIYVFPVLNVSTATFCNKIWQTRFKPKGFKNILALIFCTGHIIGNLVFTVFLMSASNKNYPGGHAMTLLHTFENNHLDANYTIHIGNYAAQTGVTRFTQLSAHWTYSKKENLEPGCEELMSFTHLIVGSSSRDNEEMLHYRNTHNVMSTVQGFSHVSFNYNTFPPLKIKTKTQIFLLKKKFIKSGVKQNIKKIVEEFKNEQDSEKKIDLNLDLLDKSTKKNKHKQK
ncbi:probable Dol-P-Man:Man(7)GlcNAc(2)-PP-Dol alpha-1,6-mannosyltransferase [Rhopalosiphum maidis]|uniref:probable Dol-P-Man:Man(7)GlcNAc(2)-PP-Dol alpha-1,6-mannosyltransferase n=1 Tax=Rhopalosiphum maidis TaxID=43146 RepID=UPI000EFEDAF8|nr:probable Dol-P-Man:Man(7)GlcNAc(2)-PP-Dol alpha-1,6-mannosyltransferase [Rhopalosiphum maidis]